MSPVAHTGLGLLGWELAASRKTWRSLGLFVLASNLADADFLFALAFGPRPLFAHQWYTHNLFFVLATSGLLALALPKGKDRFGLVLTGLSHLAVDLVVIDTARPIGFRLLYPFSGALFNVGLFPYLERRPAGAVVSAKNMAVLALEAAVFVVPVLVLYGRRFRGYVRERQFWLFEPAQGPGRERDQGFEEVEGGVDRDPEEAEGKEEEPDEGEEEKRQQGHRPADDQKNEPEEEFRHVR